MIGAVFGTIFHTATGAYKGARGDKFESAFRKAGKYAPRTAITFGTWGSCFSILDCSISHFRKKDDIFNPILAGTLVGASLPARRGKLAMLVGAVGGFLILSVIEGLNIWFSRRMIQDQSRYPMGMPGAGGEYPGAGGPGSGGGSQVYQ